MTLGLGGVEGLELDVEHGLLLGLFLWGGLAGTCARRGTGRTTTASSAAGAAAAATGAGGGGHGDLGDVEARLRVGGQ